MKNIIILIGHGKYATGIKTTIALVVGPTVGVFYIDFLEEDSSDTLMEKAIKVVEKNKDKNVLFICDILGGTPFKTAVEVSLSYSSIGVVAGCNMSAIIEIIIEKDSFELEELEDMLVSKTKNSVCKYNKNKVSHVNDRIEDGI